MLLHDHPVLDAGLRLALSALLALPLGWDPRQRFHSASLRAYPLLAVCICGFMIVAVARVGGPSEEADVINGVLNGIGFVGTGAILRTSGGAEGITTAVSLWVTGAIAMSVAFGAPLLAATELLALRLLQPLKRKPGESEDLLGEDEPG